ncbi:MAG: pantetheine-phosphate adenylyltransferase [Chloroflexi bacterium]|nr:pantetheine-phosphate adenylyltransferase [Chloroflexota bacterium]
MTRAIYPGSFDPITKGHLDIAERASFLFEELIICVYDTPSKSLLFTTDERVKLCEEAVGHLKNVRVTTYTRDLTVALARRLDAKVMVRGLRSGTDFSYEFELALMNRQIASDVESVFLMTSAEYQFVSSSLLKEAASLGGGVMHLVPPGVADALRRKYRSENPTG